MQIAVAVAHESVVESLQQGCLVPGQLGSRPAMQESKFFLVNDVAEMVEVFPEIVNRLPGEALTFAVVRSLRSGVPCSNSLAEFFHVADAQQAGRKLPVEEQLLVKTQHLHRILQRLAVTADNRFCRGSRYRNDVEIELRRPRLVQAQLLLAEMPAFLQGAEIQEIQHHGLLDLVGVVACEDHPGDVRLHEFNVVCRVGKRIFP